jgi:DNA-3-methyladenine glycosylase I
MNPNCQTSPKKSLKKFDCHKETKTTVSPHKVSAPISPRPVTPKSDSLKKKVKLNLNSGNDLVVPGTISSEYRQKGSLTHEERKIKVAHYGRVGSSKNVEAKITTLDLEGNASDVKTEKRCSFITPYSGN